MPKQPKVKWYICINCDFKVAVKGAIILGKFYGFCNECANKALAGVLLAKLASGNLKKKKPDGRKNNGKKSVKSD